MSGITRREFMQTTASKGAGAALGLGVLAKSTASWAKANDRIRVGQIGIRGRGMEHTRAWTRLDNVEIAAVCDIDENLLGPYVENIFTKRKEKEPAVYTDVRKMLEDDSIDAVSIATPNHWHSLMGIWALQAGKHVYCEKPCSHNVWEGRQLANAAKKYGKVVQHGSQIRSNPGIIEAIQKLNEGVIGEVYMARGLCYKWRDSIGHKPDAPVPPGVHYDLWLGPAPERAFSENRFHYNWHWHWDYGNGDIGNQGIHQMDVARWGLGVDMPSKIMSMGGMYLFDDDKEVPNTMNTSFEFPDAGPHGKMIVFDTRPWITNDEAGAKIGNVFYGSEGYMVIDTYSHYQVFLGQKEEPGPTRDEGNDMNHYTNFIESIRANDPSMVNAPIEEGHKSAAMCHLGLISTKLGRAVEFDPVTETIEGDAEATKMLTRDYRAPFVVPEVNV